MRKILSTLAVLVFVAAAAQPWGAPADGTASVTPPPVPEGLTVSEPLAVGDMDEPTFDRLYIKTEGDGVTVGNTAVVTLTDCYIDAGGVGVRAVGGAEVRIRNCIVLGSAAAVSSEDDAEVHAMNSFFSGRVATDNNGEFFDEGANSLN